MAIFLSASDETLAEGIFHHAGYVAPLRAWTDVLVPAWIAKVLDGPPCIDEFHMTDLRSRSWREKRGITEEDAENRIDAAVEVISQTKGLFAVRSSIDNTHFSDHADGLRFKLNDPKRAPAEFVADYPSFHGYLYLVLAVCSTYPMAERVDFVIERKREVFPAMHDFHEGLQNSFMKIGLPRFAEIVGELLPSDKKRIPVQVADVLCWHTQRSFAHDRNPAITFSEVDAIRLSKLARLGTGHTWPKELAEELCAGLFEDWRKLNEVG